MGGRGGCYYLGLDGDKRPIRSVASNQGHLLWAGAVTDERARRVVNRLMEADMWSGWVRTLSADHCAYNPLSYQLGSVWPTTTPSSRPASAAMDMTRRGAGLRALYSRPPNGPVPATSRGHSGLARDDGSFPVQYLGRMYRRRGLRSEHPPYQRNARSGARSSAQASDATAGTTRLAGRDRGDQLARRRCVEDLRVAHDGVGIVAQRGGLLDVRVA